MDFAKKSHYNLGMKIRTITTGFNLKFPLSENQIQKIAEFTLKAKHAYIQKGYEVQTVRMATQPWEKYRCDLDQLNKLILDMEALCLKYGIDYFSFGSTFYPESIKAIYSMIQKTQMGFCSAMVSDKRKINYAVAKQTASLIKKLSRINSDGFANLRFAALFNINPGTPFFPAGYHQGPATFALGTENSDLVYAAFSKARNLEDAKNKLSSLMNREFRKLEKIAYVLSQDSGIRYGGIDASIAPSVRRQESVVYACEKLGLGKFGDVGTLFMAKIITDAVQSLDVKTCGYSGLMLPLLEDYGLAQRNIQGQFDLTHLLLYSAVCGTGLDTIPLPGNVTEKKLYSLILDIAALSNKLNKPLSARLMPIPGRKAGEMTDYDFPYFVNSKIMQI